MSREEAIERLPAALGTALRLRDGGYPDEVIAAALGIPVQSVSVTMRVAYAKLSNLGEAERAG